MSAIAPSLAHHLNAHTIVPWAEVDSFVRRQIQAATGIDAGVECVIYPESQDELATVLELANRNHWSVLPLGAGSKLSWGGLAASSHLAVSTARLTRLVDHAVGDLTVTAEAGMPLSQLQSMLSGHRQWLPISPTYPQATLGGIVATADTGALRHRYGGIRDMLIGLTFVRYDGGIAHAGGRVVKNVAGYDLMKLLTGSFGTLGIISEVTFRLYPMPEASETLVLTGSVEAIAQSLQTLMASSLTPTAVELVATETMRSLNLGTEMGLLIRFHTIPVSIEQQIDQLLGWATTAGLRGDRFTGDSEADLWQHVQGQLSVDRHSTSITCKIGVLPAASAIVLDKISHRLNTLEFGMIHAGSGLGMLRFHSSAESAQDLLAIRQLCESQSGFLSILDAPQPLKEAIDVWGYAGNALDAMRRIKQQFDPHAILSPGRFVSGL